MNIFKSKNKSVSSEDWPALSKLAPSFKTTSHTLKQVILKHFEEHEDYTVHIADSCAGNTTIRVNPQITLRIQDIINTLQKHRKKK